MKNNFYKSTIIKSVFMIGLFCITKLSFGQFSTGAGDISQQSAGSFRYGFPTYTSNAGFQVKNASVLFDGTTGTTPAVTTGTFLFWSPAKGAFRAGIISTGSNWSDANTGYNSFACGLNTKASGGYSFASGSLSNATGDQSFASGSSTIASGPTSFASGAKTIASGSTSFASGFKSQATGTNSTSFGQLSRASGDLSTAFGDGSTANAYNSFVVGRFNQTLALGNLTSWTSNDDLFVIGNGTDELVRSNAMLVKKNGDTRISNRLTIGATSTIQTLDVNGRMLISNGVIQKGGTAITTTFDLGLYSRNATEWIRIVTNSAPIVFYSDGGTSGGIGTNPLMTIAADGKVGIGSGINYNGTYKLYVESGILTEKVKVAVKNSAAWSDFVFDKNYKLMPLTEVENFITENNHLPSIPSAAEVVANGIDLGEMNAKLLQKIEELTLYVIGLEKRINQIEK